MSAAILDEDTDKNTDQGPADARGRLVRLCLSTGETKPVEEMIRYVVAPDGAIVPDIPQIARARRMDERDERSAGARDRAQTLQPCVPRQGKSRARFAATRRAAFAARGARRPFDREQGGTSHHRLRKGESNARWRTARCAPTCERRGRRRPPQAQSPLRKSPIRKRRRKSGCFRGNNWTWHLGGQMWYMLPCSTTRRLGLFSRTV